MLILTSPTIQGKEITKYYGLVAGDALLGANLYKEIAKASCRERVYKYM